MNERIRELADQAVKYSLSNVNRDSEFFTPIAMEKFAELIVRECLTQIRGVSNGYLDYRDQIEDGMRDACIDTIKHHFGVEE